MMRWEPEKKLWKYGLQKCKHPAPIVFAVVMGPPDRRRRGRRWQCMECGKLESEPLPIADHPDAPEFDAAKLAAWSDARSEAGKAAQEHAQRRYAMRQQAVATESADWFEGYNEFLQSDVWHQMRARVLARDQNLCQAALQGCLRRATQVHHTSYSLHNALGCQPAYDLVAICVPCHEKITAAERKLRR